MKNCFKDWSQSRSRADLWVSNIENLVCFSRITFFCLRMTDFYLACNVYVQLSYSYCLLNVIYAHHAMVAFK